MNFWQRISQWIPHPFKYIRNKLNIEAEWQQFMSHVHPHRYKIYVATAVCSYPLYKSYLPEIRKQLSNGFGKLIGKALQKDDPPFQIIDNFTKNLIGSILSDQNIKHEGLEYVNSLIKDDKFVTDILQLLLSGLKSTQFLDGLKHSSKDIILEVLADKQIEEALKIKIVSIVQSQQVKNAFIKLIQTSFSSPQSIDTMVNLLTRGIVHQNVKKSLSESVGYSVRELLVDEQTLNQLKIFIFFLLRKFENDDEIKGMMDILFAKGLGLTKKKKQTDLQKILKSKVKKTENSPATVT